MLFRKGALTLAAALLVGSFVAGDAQAGDCVGVKFEFNNGSGALVRVKSVKIKGNDGEWVEDIANKQIETGKEHTTGKQVLNKLDSGKTGTFTVLYDRWDANNKKWEGKSQSWSGLSCQDNKTFSFKLTNQ